MNSTFERFIKEREFLSNVAPATLEWYRQSLAWLRVDKPTASELKDFVLRMREAGLKASSCNCRIRAVNSYLRWAGSEHKVPKLKEPQKVLPVFSVEDIGKFAAWKPKTLTQHRLQVLLLLLADTGCRISELLCLQWEDVSFDDLLLCVRGKGDKQRRIPFSPEARRFLFKYQQKAKHDLVFPARLGGMLGRRDVLRDTKALCRKLGVRIPERTLHALRHSFAIHYLRAGGSVFHLQKTLGHSDLAMTRKYANLLTEDLQKIHQKVSLLSAAL